MRKIDDTRAAAPYLVDNYILADLLGQGGAAVLGLRVSS
jgi:hypothetical protein